jgi:hypothetical protein
LVKYWSIGTKRSNTRCASALPNGQTGQKVVKPVTGGGIDQVKPQRSSSEKLAISKVTAALMVKFKLPSNGQIVHDQIA